MGALEKIAQIQEELSRTQKNKATEYHIGLLKGKLARLRRELLEPQPGASSGEDKGLRLPKPAMLECHLLVFPRWVNLHFSLR